VLESYPNSKDWANLPVCNGKTFLVLGFVFFVGDIINGTDFDSGYLALGPTARWKYFIGN